MIDFDELLKDVPDALQPVYRTAQANDEVPLYEGRLKLHLENAVGSGRGRVYVAWLPTPRVAFEMEIEETLDVGLLENRVQLELVDVWPNEHIDAEVRSASILFAPKSHPIAGAIRSWKQNPSVAVRRIIFHLTNFRAFKGNVIREGRGVRSGRMTLAFGDWKVLIDDIAQKDLSKNLKASGGFAITHVGSLERIDGATFTTQEAQKVWDGLYWFLSFCNGCWTGPVLPVGYGENGEVLSHEWELPRLAPYGVVRSWFSDYCDDVAEQSYPGFAARWSSETWTQAVKSVFYWYLIANAPGGAVETGIVLAHVAFDTLGWTLFVEDSQSMSNSGYDGLGAAEKLCRLLGHCGVPADIPKELAALAAVAQAENWSDGPDALAKVRNAYVHPSLTNRERLSRAGVEAQYQVWVLAMYYLELILLYLFDYQGDFTSRLVGGCLASEAVRKVPWA